MGKVQCLLTNVARLKMVIRKRDITCGSKESWAVDVRKTTISNDITNFKSSIQTRKTLYLISNIDIEVF